MREFKHRFRVNANLEQVAAFHSSSSALKLLTPPPMFIQFHSVEAMSENSLADFTMWLGPIPIRWTAKHFDFKGSSGFSDCQVRGPFESWTHVHHFEKIHNGLTEIEDHIQAEPGKGLWRVLLSNFMWINLPVLFSYRSWATRRAVEQKS
jgi:ligand-binding SRPBCC domain-containing protein